jgi:hypothetical protein
MVSVGEEKGEKGAEVVERRGKEVERRGQGGEGGGGGYQLRQAPCGQRGLHSGIERPMEEEPRVRKPLAHCARRLHVPPRARAAAAAAASTAVSEDEHEHVD